MIILKTREEIGLIRESSLLVGKTLAEVGSRIQPGVSTLALDKLAETFIRDHGGIPAFKGYKGFKHSLCISCNDQIVHGVPSGYLLREGDVVSVDCGVLLNSFYGDSAYTFAVGEIDEAKQRLLRVTLECLWKGVSMALQGKRIGDIGFAVQEHAESNGYSVVRELVGHGIGRKLHEAPEVPNYGSQGKGPMLKEGMVIAIEPMINMGKKDVRVDRDGWTCRTKDGLPSAHFEHTVAVGIDGPEVLSTFEFIGKQLEKQG